MRRYRRTPVVQSALDVGRRQRRYDLATSDILPLMRTVGSSALPSPSLLPTAAALRAAAVHQATGNALAAVATTGIEKGIYRFKSHAAMNRMTDQALVRALAINARLRAGHG